MFVAWTTVASSADAERLAGEVISRGLAACAQIAAIVSHYRWEGRTERAEEWRISFKCLPEQLPALEAYVLKNHPYETPEWIAVRADRVAEKYLSWAVANSTSGPL